MAGLEGFELSITADDTSIAMGSINGVTVAAGTVDAAADADADYLIVWDGSAYDHILAAAQVAGQTVLGTATVASFLVTVVTMADRGRDVPASA